MKRYRSIHAYVCGEKTLNFNFVCKFELLKETTLALLFVQSIEASLGRFSSRSMCENWPTILSLSGLWFIVTVFTATLQSVSTVNV